MPETLKGLWRQRLRWAQGGAEVLIKYFKMLFRWKTRRMWGIYLEYMVSIFWAYIMGSIMLLWLLGKFLPMPEVLYIDTILPSWHGMVLAVTCLLQFGISFLIDHRYETGLGRYYYWIIWYPMLYWLLTMSTAIVGLPKAAFKRKGTRATWVSPDRGLAP
jgi:biofilm PGA synthesis N-glycosyltransferase PgaC